MITIRARQVRFFRRVTGLSKRGRRPNRGNLLIRRIKRRTKTALWRSQAIFTVNVRCGGSVMMLVPRACGCNDGTGVRKKSVRQAQVEAPERSLRRALRARSTVPVDSDEMLMADGEWSRE
jgi:hypothetical protein